MTGQAGTENKAQSTVLSNFQGKTTHLLEFSIPIILIKVNGAIFPQMQIQAHLEKMRRQKIDREIV